VNVAQPIPGSPLTPRERDVLVMVGKGFSNPEVGALLHMARPTVNGHLKIIYAKLEVRNRVEAAKWAWEMGLL